MLHFPGEEDQDGAGGLPVHPRPVLRLPPPAARRGHGLEHARRPGARSRARDLLARCVQHETDHLDGVLFVDRLDAEAPQGRDAGDPRGRVGRRADRSRSRPARTRCSARHGETGTVRLVFAGTPAAALPAPARRCWRSGHEVVAVLTRPDAPAGRGRAAAAVPGRASWADERRHRRCSRPARRASRSSCDRLRGAAPDCVPGGRLRRAGAPGRAGRPAGTAGSTCTSRCCPPGAAPRRCSTRCWPATRSPARRRSCWRRASTPARCYGVVTEPVRPARHRRRPARPARRRPAPGCSSPPWTASTTGALRPRPQPADGRLARPEDHRGRRPGRLVGRRRPRWTAGSGPAPRRPAPGRRGADDRLKLGPVRAGRATALAARRAVGRPTGAGRHRARPRSGSARSSRRARPMMPAADWARGARPAAGETLG